MPGPSTPAFPSSATASGPAALAASPSRPAAPAAPSGPASRPAPVPAPSEPNTFLPVDATNHDGARETKIILLSGFSDKELHDVIDAYRLNKAMPKAIFATVTDVSENFKVKDLLAELELEKKQIEAAAALKAQDGAQK